MPIKTLQIFVSIYEVLLSLCVQLSLDSAEVAKVKYLVVKPDFTNTECTEVSWLCIQNQCLMSTHPVTPAGHC